MQAPKFMLYKNPDKKGWLLSGRWLRNGFDILKKDGTIFIQFGKRVKFIYYSPPSQKLPLFLVSASWHTKFKLQRLRFGTASKPLDLTKAWRKQCPKGSGQNRSKTTIQKKISSTTGL